MNFWMKVTDEHIPDSKSLHCLTDGILKFNKILGRLFSDSSYHSNDIFNIWYTARESYMYQSKKEFC